MDVYTTELGLFTVERNLKLQRDFMKALDQIAKRQIKDHEAGEKITGYLKLFPLAPIHVDLSVKSEAIFTAMLLNSTVLTKDTQITDELQALLSDYIILHTGNYDIIADHTEMVNKLTSYGLDKYFQYYFVYVAVNNLSEELADIKKLAAPYRSLNYIEITKCIYGKHLVKPPPNLTGCGDIYVIECPLYTGYTFTSINLASLKNVIIIKDYFLSGCLNLRDVDLSPLTELRLIGNYFLSDCYALNGVTTSSLQNVISIGNSFMTNTNIRKIDLSPLSNLKFIGDNFMAGNKELSDVDLSNWVSVLTIGSNFMLNCNLEDIDLSDLTKVAKIGDNFLAGNRIDEPDILNNLKSLILIGDGFLCRNYLYAIELKYLVNLRVIGRTFLSNNHLTTINLEPLRNVIKIGTNFLSINDLEELELEPIENIKFIGRYSLSNNPLKLDEVNHGIHFDLLVRGR